MEELKMQKRGVVATLGLQKLSMTDAVSLLAKFNTQ
jgi:hypothetical protein